MNRNQLLDHLAQAEAHLAQGERLIARQRVLIERLKREGHDVAEARELLRQLEDIHSMQIADHARLLRELRTLT